MTTKKNKILFAPIHFFYTTSYGSELLWAEKIFNGVAKNRSVLGIAYCCLGKEARFKNIIAKKTVEAPYFYSLTENLKFVDFYRKAGRRLIKEENINIVHHILPFYIGRTFNPLLLFGRGYKKVIGPIQTPLDYDNKDMRNNKLFQQKDKGLASGILIKIYDFCFGWLSDLTLRRADAIVVINQEAKKMLVKRGIDPQKISIIPPGINTKEFVVGNKKNRRIELITVGYLMKRKGVELIINSMKDIVKENKGVILRIVGDGPQKKNLENQVKKLGLGEQVIFEGLVPHDEVAKLYQQADIFVSMSRSESWGQMYLEAMASGLAVVTSRTVGSESIIEEDFGLLLNQEDVNGLTSAVLDLINNPKKLAQFKKRAREHAVGVYDWENSIIPRYIALYDRLIKTK